MTTLVASAVAVSSSAGHPGVLVFRRGGGERPDGNDGSVDAHERAQLRRITPRRTREDEEER
jgi:hypothetical protein